MNKQKYCLKKLIFGVILSVIFSLNMTFLTIASDTIQYDLDALEKQLNDLKENPPELKNSENKELRSNSEDILYTERFSLVTIYRHNVLIKSSFKFKIDVKNNNKVSISADGPYRQAGYMWGDDYHFYIYDAYGRQKFYDRVTYGGDVYNDVISLLNKLQNVDIKVGDNIRIDSINYNKTVRFNFENKTLYTNGSSIPFKYPPIRQHKYAITRQGFIKQTLEEPATPRGMFYQALLLNVKDVNTGQVVQKKLNFENNSSGRIRFNDGEFGTRYDYVWAEDYTILAYDENGELNAGAVLRRGRSVDEGIEAIIDSFDNAFVGHGNRLSFGTSGNFGSLKLIENSGKYYVNPFLTLFTCTNTNFSNGVDARTEFIVTDYGLMESNDIR